MNINKAEKVEQAYDDACWFENFSSEGCYRVAVDTAYELGGIEIANSNDRAKSFAPSMTFEFDDLSSAQVTYGGVYLLNDDA